MDISIILTAFNASAHIIDTLDSICLQTYQQFEIVIVDDGSTDNTLTIIRDHFDRHPLIKVHIYACQHIGRAAALNYAIKQANYDWIAIIDADDLWNFKKLEQQVNLISDYRLSFLATESKVFYQNRDVNIRETVTADSQPALRSVSLNKMLYVNRISHSSVLVSKHLIQYDLNRKTQVDYDMWLRLLESGCSLFILDAALTYHRIHPGQSFEAKNRLRYAWNATVLQLKYSIRNIKFLPIFFITMKFGYYILLPKKLKLKLRQIFV